MSEPTTCVCGHAEAEHVPLAEYDLDDPDAAQERCVEGCACECFDEFGETCVTCGARLPWRNGGDCDACVGEHP